MQNKNTQEFDDIIRDIIENPKVQEMKKYKQHYETSTFDHCYMVSYYCYKVCKKLKLDYKSIATLKKNMCNKATLELVRRIKENLIK